MVAQEFQNRLQHVVWEAATLRRTFFVEIFGCQDGDEHAGPVGNGVSEERADVRCRVSLQIEDDPGNQNCRRSQTKRMFANESVLTQGLLLRWRVSPHYKPSRNPSRTPPPNVARFSLDSLPAPR